MKMTKRKLMEGLAKFLLRYGRGSSLVSFFTSMARDVVYLGIIIDLSYRYLNFSIPPKIIPILVVGAVVVYYILGYVDEKVGFWKFQNRYANKELNPLFDEMHRDIKEIKDGKN